MGPPPAALGLTSPRTCRGPHPEPLRPSEQAVANRCVSRASGPDAYVLASSDGLREGGAALPHEMEWHMKRLCQRCGVSPDGSAQSEPHASTRARLEKVLLWRDRPTSSPSK